MIRQGPHRKSELGNQTTQLWTSSEGYLLRRYFGVFQPSVVIDINIGIVFANHNDFDIHIDGCYQGHTTVTSI